MSSEDEIVQHSETPEVSQERKPDAWRFGAELIRTAIIVVALAYLIRLFILQPFVVEGSSMYPRFQTSDFLIVDKISYHLHQPERGDIIVFKFPGDPTLTTNYVKRIIGVPGDVISIANGQVKVTNAAHPDGVTLTEPYVAADNTTTVSPGTSVDQFSVPPGNFFVLGDNRKASSDSREWGFLPQSDVIGRVVLQAFPLKRASIISHARYSNL